MPRVIFTPHLRKHLTCEMAEVAGQANGRRDWPRFSSENQIAGLLSTIKTECGSMS